MNTNDMAMTVDAFPDGAWQTAAYCGPNGGNCVEVNLASRGLAGVRDSKTAGGPVLAFDDVQWAAFLNAAKSGWFDRG